MLALILASCFCLSANAFAPAGATPKLCSSRSTTAAAVCCSAHKDSTALQKEKEALLGLIGRAADQRDGIVDPVLADPETKEPIRFMSKGALLGGSFRRRGTVKYDIVSPSNTYSGSSASYIDLLEPVKEDSSSTLTSDNAAHLAAAALKRVTPLIPPGLRSVLAAGGVEMDDYVPMRDLFTSPAVSYAYERGWRQGFAQAGFPGADKEFVMAKEFFAPALTSSSTVVDMSCATGLFTRRFVLENAYDRVLGCDYSESMLSEARRRINSDPKISDSRTRLDLVRLDVGKIPMQDASVDALHAGAAMHCWPELKAAATEIYRVLKPGGRYFATTFLAPYFSMSQQAADITNQQPLDRAYNFFQSAEEMSNLMQAGGFEEDKIQVEVLGPSCLVIRCEK
uniref:Methyltransferase type 11 domain-containing protein n=1 Tax=Grammatophora oceanica TaxID=210454 RepID=A0A7S1Y1Y9_9STRA|mmetsp:Transcript_11174/g.16318  ORF Transcript_11174/g.16318 Transcript_11174/m.16318 type:complete len:397 (+) Transcript_11174:95-1285(+)